MRTSWKIGRVAGIDVFLHPTFFLVLLFPGATRGGLFGLSVVLAGFGCILLHEFGHALMARRFGVETLDITLYPIGGVARLSRMPRSPGAELLIALAGPAVNVALAAGLVGSALLGAFGEFASYMLAVNVMLAAFNLIPAFPMDGGRVLRALLSGWLGRVRATAAAAMLGRGLALAFGFWCLATGHWFPQLFLAAFVYMAAGMELMGVVADENRRRYDGGQDVGNAPPGYRWVQRGQGAWQLAPVVVNVHVQGRGRARWN